MGRSLQHESLHSLGYLHMLLRILEHLYGPFTALKSPNIYQNAHFSAFRALQLGPLVADRKS